MDNLDDDVKKENADTLSTSTINTRGYQQEMLDESLRRNIIIAMDTGSGKTHIAVLRMKMETERQPTKVSWFLAPTVALCEQQKSVIQAAIPVSVGLISGALEPNQWKDPELWKRVIQDHPIMITTPQVLLDALRHSYISLGRDISLLVFDEAHHAVDNHPYNRIMIEFYFIIPEEDGVDLLSVRRPYVLGLTASPIYGGNVEKAFKTIEANLDCTIRAPRLHRQELEKFVHRPVFRHIMYDTPEETDAPFSTNLAALRTVAQSLDIQQDPYVHGLRNQLTRALPNTPEHTRLDQKLSKVIRDKDSFTHKGIRDFERSASAILYDLGAWAADWYVWQVLEQAKRAANPYNNILLTWKSREKEYLLSILDKIVVTPASFSPIDIIEDSSDKIKALIDVLLSEKQDVESENESYSGLVFVQRRDIVLALTATLQNHPLTKDIFRFGSLIGTSDSKLRHSFLDITRVMLKDTHEATLADFKIGEKTVIISTSVAEEGIDIQACGSVIRWDPPPNMASWAQSRGRARKQRSTYTMMFASGGGVDHQNVLKWQNLERQMVALYNDPSRDLPQEMLVDEEVGDDEIEDDDMELRVPSTGALLTLHSAVSHLSHFCAIIPNSTHADNRPLYDIDPPEFPEGWHSFDNRSRTDLGLYTGPFGSKVTLPRTLPLPNREFATERIYKTKISAHRHAAFVAYKALYDAELLNDHLLPITSTIEGEIKELLEDVEKRAGMTDVSVQMNPWALVDSDDTDTPRWSVHELVIGDLPPLFFFTTSRKISLPNNEGPTLHRVGRDPLPTRVTHLASVTPSASTIEKAQHYTRMLFWTFYGSRMVWEKTDFPYLFLPIEEDVTWSGRRAWLAQRNRSLDVPSTDDFFLDAETFGKSFSFPTTSTNDVHVVGCSASRFTKPMFFLGWRFDPLNEEEEERFRSYYSRFEDLEITYPLLVTRHVPNRMNFLLPVPHRDDPPTPPIFHLLPRLASVIFLSHAESEYAFLLPSILRFLSNFITTDSLRERIFHASPLADIPISLLTTALTAPVAGERVNYQRLETLGDCVIKFMVSIQLFAEYPLWHEGYLAKKKDHTVSNVRLAKESIVREIFQWIIRDRIVLKKWKPAYLTPVQLEPPKGPTKGKQNPPKSPKKPQKMSTKVLADVVESLIGASYLHGGFDLAYECLKLFDLGIKWQPLPTRIENILSRVRVHDHGNFPPQLEYVERILGYTFNHPLLLIEALTHASYEQNSYTSSYDRLEFLGDCVLDMVVTDILYHAPGKNYSPGHIHLRRSASVNAHILAYICLSRYTTVDAAMPISSSEGVALQPETHLIYLWQCLLHSSPRVLEDQRDTLARYRRGQEEIESSLLQGSLFPWAQLLRLQPPKFFSDLVESLIGAVFLDSEGNLDVAIQVIRNLGILPVLEHIIRDDVDVLHPASRLSLWASKHDKKLEYKYTKEKGNVCCTLIVDDIEECSYTSTDRGRAGRDEVRYMVADVAIKKFRLRDVDVNYTLMKKRRGPTARKKEGKKGNNQSGHP